jgi:hypothetical protein
MIGIPIDIQRSEAEVLADVDRVWEQTRHVPMGTAPDAAALEAMERAQKEAQAVAVAR